VARARRSTIDGLTAEQIGALGPEHFRDYIDERLKENGGKMTLRMHDKDGVTKVYSFEGVRLLPGPPPEDGWGEEMSIEYVKFSSEVK